MLSHRWALFHLIIYISVLLTACAADESPPTATVISTSTDPPPASPTASDTPEPSPSSIIEPTGTIEPAAVEHLSLPAEPLELSNLNYALDISTAPYGPEGYAFGDLFLNNRFERPFDGEDMVYVGYLDIRTVNFYADDLWYYFLVYLEADLPESGDLTYGVEFDLNLDGRGDFLVYADLPDTTEWSTLGVGVYHDQDEDIGGERALFADYPDDSLTGYEEIIFQDGVGEDPDLAWARRSPDYSFSVEIAIKRELFDEGKFLWSGWADGGWRDPSRFEYHDRITIDDAGHPYLDYAFYPVKELNLLDSTCRSWYGFTPTGEEPGLCQIADFTPTEAPSSGGSGGSRKGSDSSAGAMTGWCVPKVENGKRVCWSACLLVCPQSEKVDECIPCKLDSVPSTGVGVIVTTEPGDGKTTIEKESQTP